MSKLFVSKITSSCDVRYEKTSSLCLYDESLATWVSLYHWVKRGLVLTWWLSITSVFLLRPIKSIKCFVNLKTFTINVE